MRVVPLSATHLEDTKLKSENSPTVEQMTRTSEYKQVRPRMCG